MKSDLTSPEPVVLLVDDKIRDLNVATLIAHHLRKRGVECHLEPLEAFRGVLAAYRPGMIIFNHLNGSHLVDWSKRIASMGVLTGVLLNEGFVYDPEEMRYISGRYHSDAHIDYFFCWNEPHREAIISEGGHPEARIEVIGVPRFDFYFEPWSHLNYRPRTERSLRPRVLFCTNFVTAHFLDFPREMGDRFFAPWVGKIALFDNYWRSVEAHANGRKRVFDFLESLVAADRYEIILRPHPRESSKVYEEWVESLPAEKRNWVTLDKTSNIAPLILGCDVEISCETCTTALESWIAGKPTIELELERDPLWYREEHAVTNIPCSDPAALPDLIDRQLKNPEQAAKREIRRRHLQKWCNSPDGHSSERFAAVVASAVSGKRATNWSGLTANDYRRALKLHATRILGHAYHYDPFAPLKRLLPLKRDHQAGRRAVYQKSIMPRDVLDARRRLERVLTERSGS
jgi:surface carbohydrate biosynthesis protein